ncbi:histidine phosphatase family protein [Gordonia crocea]|uniref:Putative phosphoglycerate mutase n=1 Tax=Gordonia crocea TaxID=589162 RepID=A0A7M3SUG5_9ACTN|nr:histidine phosphatase family protein [Gordonia crocea]GED96289.1 putative phosphoglycerate mutase [Gordonia crocea]
MARLYLVRHGETTSNVMNRLDTALPGAALTDFGVRQAARFALDNMVAAEAPLTLVSSVARRAQQTAEVVGGIWGVDPEVVDGLYEVQVGDLEDRNDRPAYEAFSTVVERWHHGETSERLPGGESLDDVLARYVPAIDAIAAKFLVGPEARDVFVVSHGAAIRLVAARLASIDPGFAVSNHLSNTGVVELSYTPGDDVEWHAHRWGSRVAPFDTDDTEGDQSAMG